MCSNPTMKLALIGYGNIGQAINEYLLDQPGDATISGVLTRSGLSRSEVESVTTIKALLKLEPDVVVECASQNALRSHGAQVLEAGYPLVAASIGAFADEDFYQCLVEKAGENDGRLLIPSGGLAGTDALAAAKHAGLENVTYRGSAPPMSWGLPPDTKSQVLFAGCARDACREYPKNANVVAAIAIAGTGFEKTTVELIANPELIKYRHEIQASGPFGTLSTLVEAAPITSGRRSSRLVAGSLMANALSARQ